MAMALFHSWPWRIPFMAMAHSIHGHGAFHSWPWPHSIHGHGPIPFMAMAPFHSWPWPHSIHGHGPIPFMAMAPFHSWPSPSFMAKALSLAHHITAPGKTSPYILSRTARASPWRRFRANRLNPGIKSYWRWGWFRGVAAVDKGDHGTSYIRICIGHKWGYARIYGGKNGHICAYLWAMNAHIYGPCMRISMEAAMAMYAHIYGSSNGHECAYLWAMYAHIYGPCMRISIGHVCAYLWAMNAHIYRPCMRVSMAAVMAM